MAFGLAVLSLLGLNLSVNPQSLVVGVPLFGFVIGITFLEVSPITAGVDILRVLVL